MKSHTVSCAQCGEETQLGDYGLTMSRKVKLVGWLSGESDLAARVKAHNPCKYCTVWQNGLG